jgi:hypothetical protein
MHHAQPVVGVERVSRHDGGDAVGVTLDADLTTRAREHQLALLRRQRAPGVNGQHQGSEQGQQQQRGKAATDPVHSGSGGGSRRDGSVVAAVVAGAPGLPAPDTAGM